MIIVYNESTKTMLTEMSKFLGLMFKVESGWSKMTHATSENFVAFRYDQQ